MLFCSFRQSFFKNRLLVSRTDKHSLLQGKDTEKVVHLRKKGLMAVAVKIDNGGVAVLKREVLKPEAQHLAYGIKELRLTKDNQTVFRRQGCVAVRDDNPALTIDNPDLPVFRA